jgi:single-strand DNA-binding protein
MSINRVVISGNLTRDAELRRTQSGMAILNLGVAVNDRRRNNQTGEWEDYANFIDCVLFGARAEAIANYLVKGTKVAIEGKLRWSQWERDGQKRSKIEVVIDEIEFMSSRNAGQGSGGFQGDSFQGGFQGGNASGYQYSPAPAASAAAPAAAPAIDASSSVYDDDIPF